MTEDRRLTPAQVDDLCTAYDAEKAAVEAAERKFAGAKAALLAAVQNEGYTPAHAEKTLRLDGILYVADATTASTVEINDVSVAELQLELSRTKLPRVFRMLFDRRVKYSLRKDAASAIKVAIGGSAEAVQTRLLALFASCFAVNTKAPSLSVDLAATLRKKEADAAAKAAKKAAREAKKKGGAK